ncbi:MAG: hypothetical protein QF830_06700 [Rhodospirillales bacterium]|jgi:hypothetical protein|nr:hypothetical protein [Rhodospirillales bacterium]MDP6883805.1 hypothetical protein [Rhodospirillales bacterium]|tara:strand:- start:226 stop:492 length:267 start_codon:yes stop_codon:yes gene_type:complete
MDIQQLKAFFLWCTVMNGALLILSILIFILVPDFVYTAHNAMFAMPRETFNVVIYAFLGLYKIVFLVFNAVPYGALLMVQIKGASGTA